MFDGDLICYILGKMPSPASNIYKKEYLWNKLLCCLTLVNTALFRTW